MLWMLPVFWVLVNDGMLAIVMKKVNSEDSEEVWKTEKGKGSWDPCTSDLLS